MMTRHGNTSHKFPYVTAVCYIRTGRTNGVRKNAHFPPPLGLIPISVRSVLKKKVPAAGLLLLAAAGQSEAAKAESVALEQNIR